MASKRALLSLPPSQFQRLIPRPTCSRPLYRQSASILPRFSHAIPHPQRRWNSQSTPASSAPSPTSTAPSTPPSEPPAARKTPTPIKSWSYEDILSLSLSQSPSPTTLLIDVREPSETAHGIIPTALTLPITSNPDAFFLPAEEFRERFGWEKPKETVNVVFYCKAGVRSRAAARMARDAGWGGDGGVGEYRGSWDGWSRLQKQRG